MMSHVQPSVRNSGLRRLLMLNESYINNSFPIIICCDKCGKWRETSEFEEVSDVPEHWDCSMWSTSRGGKGNCDLPTDVNGEADCYVDEAFTPGSLVWAKMAGYPRWPAMVEDDPNHGEYCRRLKTKVEYHVVFLGDPPSRRWIEAKRLKPFKIPTSGEVGGKNPIQKEKLQRALEEAKRAIVMTKQNRLMEFSLAVRLGKQENARKKDMKEDLVSSIPAKSSPLLNSNAMFSNIVYYENLSAEGKLYAEYLRNRFQPFNVDTESSGIRIGKFSKAKTGKRKRGRLLAEKSSEVNSKRRTSLQTNPGSNESFNMYIIDSETDPEDYRMPNDEDSEILWRIHVEKNYPSIFQSLNALSATTTTRSPSIGLPG